MNGFRQYRGCDQQRYIDVPCEIVVSSVRNKHQDILDLIYSADPLTGFPCGAWNQFLSEKTAPEVRQFIMDYLCQNSMDSDRMDLPNNVLDHFRELDSEFVAKTSRNRYESIEDYEARVDSYIQELRESEKFKARVKNLEKVFNKKSD